MFMVMCPTMLHMEVRLEPLPPPPSPPLCPPPPPPLAPLVQLAPPGLLSLISSWISFFKSSFRAKWRRLVWIDWEKREFDRLCLFSSRSFTITQPIMK